MYSMYIVSLQQFSAISFIGEHAVINLDLNL